MKMTDKAFDDYFTTTIWRDGQSAPTVEELKAMEQRFMDVLTEQKRVGQKDGSYSYLFADNGKKIVSRIGFCKRQIKEGGQNKDVSNLLASYERLRLAMKYLDRNLYEKEMRKGIEKSKTTQRVKTITDGAETAQPIKSTVPAKPTEDNLTVVPIVQVVEHQQKPKPEAADLNKDLYTFDELLVVLQVSKNTLRGWMQKGYISYSQPQGSNKIFFQKKDVITFLENPDIKYTAWR